MLVCEVACNSLLKLRHSFSALSWENGLDNMQIHCTEVSHKITGLLALRMPYILEAGNLAADEGDPRE